LKYEHKSQMFLAMPSITLSRHLPVFIRITDEELSHCNRSLLSCSIGPHTLNPMNIARSSYSPISPLWAPSRECNKTLFHILLFSFYILSRSLERSTLYVKSMLLNKYQCFCLTLLMTKKHMSSEKTRTLCPSYKKHKCV
jgi:hypothetical protein